MALLYDDQNISYQDAIDNKTHKATGGTMNASWLDINGKPEKPRPDPVFFIDIGNNSYGRGSTIQEAKEIRAHFPGSIIRTYWPTEEDLQEEASARQKQKRYEFPF